jgi:cytochrome c553
MKKLALIFILCSPVLLYAQSNLAAGKNKAIVCVICHGAKGISTSPEWPNLAGQNVKYLIKQLKDIQQGKQRNAPTMSAMIANFNPQDMDDLAEYYAKMPTASGSTPKKFVQRGEQIYRGGDFTKHITACIACHGPRGTGNAEAGFPVLSGQHATYTATQLHAFKDGKRTNDLNHIMQDICGKMSQDDMEAVAHYIEGLY